MELEDVCHGLWVVTGEFLADDGDICRSTRDYVFD